MFSLFFSGSTVPSVSLDPDDKWFKYIQYIIPSGNAVLMMNHLANGMDTLKIWWIYPISLIYLSLFTFLALKYFKWE
ncbi:hypothetical protein [Spiroplasma turonicum]|uniref:hypothetical protein n=1 Tax=Spiroplasma turonicum TaxID=216946 RepID=UPI0009465D40|nr:hypothetical protein [Spiroplasma turonicum]